MSLRGRLTSDGQAARQTPFWICSECGNMLYPKEDHSRRCLQRVCRNCGRVDDADNNLVYVNDLRPESQAADAGVDVIKDPTLPRAVGTECSSCGHDEAVFFQAPMKGDQAMKLIFMCTRCVPLPPPLLAPARRHVRRVRVRLPLLPASPLPTALLSPRPLTRASCCVCACDSPPPLESSCAFRWVQ